MNFLGYLQMKILSNKWKKRSAQRTFLMDLKVVMMLKVQRFKVERSQSPFLVEITLIS